MPFPEIWKFGWRNDSPPNADGGYAAAPGDPDRAVLGNFQISGSCP
jgi:hypothetical protein